MLITQKEQDQRCYNQLLKEAESSDYAKEIVRVMDDIIENKRYSNLQHILSEYDLAHKEQLGEGWTELTLPYWCYAIS